MWEYALHATGLNIKMKENTAPSTILIPLDDSMLACQSAGEGVGFWSGHAYRAVGEWEKYQNEAVYEGSVPIAPYHGLLIQMNAGKWIHTGGAS